MDFLSLLRRNGSSIFLPLRASSLLSIVVDLLSLLWCSGSRVSVMTDFEASFYCDGFCGPFYHGGFWGSFCTVDFEAHSDVAYFEAHSVVADFRAHFSVTNLETSFPYGKLWGLSHSGMLWAISLSRPLKVYPKGDTCIDRGKREIDSSPLNHSPAKEQDSFPT